MPSSIHKSRDIAAPIERVWEAWTTDEGVRSFFGPGSHVEQKVDGEYEIYFMPDAPAGERGSDGMRVLAFHPPHALAFTWNAPPSIPAIRAQRTHVMIELEAIGDHTRVVLTNGGYASGADWARALEYFDRAWDVVLDRLEKRFAKGPIDWDAELSGS